MNAIVDPNAVADAAVRAVVAAKDTVCLHLESSSPMFYGTQALGRLGPATAPSFRMSTHYGSMGHALAGALGFCTATGQRALVLPGDGSLHLMNPLPAAVKHRAPIAIVVLNDARLALPYFGSERVGAFAAQQTTQLPGWDFTRQGSDRIGARRVLEPGELDDAIREALSFNGPFVVDVQIDRRIVPPVGARFESVAALSGGLRA